jgi:hypothetical protein
MNTCVHCLFQVTPIKECGLDILLLFLFERGVMH